MGATLYRCITGVLPPDSIERIHGDTLKRPSELGISISPAIEQAILKALSIRTEDRFMSMEAFICALNGDVATASAQSPSPGSTANAPQPYSGAVSSRPATFFAVLSAHLKQNPLLAVALGGALVAVVALVLFLPLSGKSGKNTSYTNSASSMNPSSASAPPGSDTPTPSQTPPGQDSDAPDDSSSGDSNDSIGTEVVTYDLGILNATIDVPAEYSVSDDGFTFTNNARNCRIETSFNWATIVPIYSLADIENYREDIVSSYAEGYGLTDAMILTAGRTISADSPLTRFSSREQIPARPPCSMYCLQ